jgi:hypothetical protein
MVASRFIDNPDGQKKTVPLKTFKESPTLRRPCTVGAPSDAEK